MTPVVRDVGSGRVEAEASRSTSIPALAGIGAGAIHAAAVGVHADHRLLASIFVVVAVLQLVTGVALLVQPGRAVAKAVVAVNAFAVAGWLLTRTVGVWLIVGLGVERPGFADTVCALLGVLAAVGAWMALGSDTRSGATSKWRPATGGRVLALASVVVLFLAVPAMSSAATDVHEHGAELAAGQAHVPADGAGARPADEVLSITNAGNGVDEGGAL